MKTTFARILATISVGALVVAVPAPTLAAGAAPPSASAQPIATAIAATTPQAAIYSGATNAAAKGITTYAAVLDRSTGKVLATSPNANTQVASASIVKLFLAAHYLVQYNGNLPSGMSSSLRSMIASSTDSVASAYWTSAAIPAMAARYGLSNTANPPGGRWGASRITAADTAQFLYRAGKDPVVGPWLYSAMAAATDLGTDGFNQNFGFNALAGGGSKQGWGGDHWTSQYLVIHSVGFTSKYIGAVLQTGGSGTYYAMRDTATHTARLIASSVPPVVSRPTTTSISASAHTAIPGQKSTITGQVLSGSTKIAGHRVRLLTRVVGGEWRTARETVTNAEGKYSFTVTGTADGNDYRVRYLGNSQPWAPSESASKRIYVKFELVGINTVPTALAAYSRATANGWVHSRQAGRSIYVQLKTPEGWVNQSAAVIGADGRFSIRFLTGAPGPKDIRLHLPSNLPKGIAASAGPARRVVVG